MTLSTSGFITFEGIEGAGKTTQARRLCEHLSGKGVQQIFTREPGGTVIGEKIRSLLLDPQSAGLVPVSELLLYGAARSQHIDEVISPALAEGKVVICDRFVDATIAYQGNGRQIPMNVIKIVNSLASADIKPDLTILLDLEPEEGLARARARNEVAGNTSTTRFDDEELEFHRRVREGYLEIAGSDPERVKIVQAGGAPEKIAKQIASHANRLLGLS